MLSDLGAMDLQWDATSPIPTRVGDLEQRVTRLVTRYPALAATASSIFARPDEALQRTERLVPSRSVRWLGPTHLRRNLAQGRLDAGGNPLGKTVLAALDVASIDTPANAYVVHVLKGLARYRDELKRQLGLEDRRLANEADRERSYRSRSMPAGKAERKAEELRRRLRELEQELDAMQLINLPVGWESFRSRPDRTASAVRFDPRFTKFTRLASQIMDRRAEAARADRLQRIAEFGRRPHNEIYEVWTVCKAFEALYRLGFRTPRNPDLEEHHEAFLRLERSGGGVYGLRKNEAVDLVHKDAPHLYIRVGYEPSIPYRGGVRTPDVMLVLRGSADRTDKSPARFGGTPYGDSPLYLDAKYQMRSVLDPGGNKDYVTKYADLASKGGKRRPHSYVVQAAPDKFVWTQRKKAGDKTSASMLGVRDEEYFPYRVGAASMTPIPPNEDSSLESRMPLVRIIYAWLVMQGVVAICPRCGGVMRTRSRVQRQDPETGLFADIFKPYIPSSGSVLPTPARHSLDCQACHLGVTANYCGSCRKDGVFVPIIKIYPRPDSEQEVLTDEWVRDYEIAEPSDVHWARHCPRCGSR